ncbi:C39 family peptidase [Olsenella sp. An290]|uniref:C39 family peptidase n=1 Tax=Olsenella sp. An290 TaxID=1965625 RepID=UPI000B39B314|nr:C39 family peptidase [Olsenella sp. An290]OUO34679.1 hypothetical protein B5F84_05750 [Olsenella sp. An290]
MRNAASRTLFRRRRDRRLAVCALVLLALGVIAPITLRAAAALPQGAAPSVAARSTPREDWRAGEVPYLYQTDPEWSQKPYAGGTIEKNGCGPTCLSMVYVALTGRTDLGPKEMAAFSERGGYTVDGMTAWALMTDGAAELGLTSEQLGASERAVRSALAAGSPVICSVGPGDFTSSGHFIVLAGIADDGQVIVRDPNSQERSERTWDLGRVLAQCANLWAFSA